MLHYDTTNVCKLLQLGGGWVSDLQMHALSDFPLKPVLRAPPVSGLVSSRPQTWRYKLNKSLSCLKR